MKEYLKMADAFPHAKVGKSPVKPWVSGEYFVFYENQAEYAAHAISSHDELVAEVERLRESLKWAVGNLPFEDAFEWSDDEDADAHYAALRLLGVEIDE